MHKRTQTGQTRELIPFIAVISLIWKANNNIVDAKKKRIKPISLSVFIFPPYLNEWPKHLKKIYFGHSAFPFAYFI
jgi:hypothetical protein